MQNLMKCKIMLVSSGPSLSSIQRLNFRITKKFIAKMIMVNQTVLVSAVLHTVQINFHAVDVEKY